jgi:hypothetical protein
MAGISVKDRQLISQLRAEHAALLTPTYDTDFNLLRWLIGYDYDYALASANLGRHLKVSCNFGVLFK